MQLFTDKLIPFCTDSINVSSNYTQTDDFCEGIIGNLRSGLVFVENCGFVDETFVLVFFVGTSGSFLGRLHIYYKAK